MFILNLTYIKPLKDVEKNLSDHVLFLKKYYDNGTFICSGRKIPRTGGVILCNAKSTQEVQDIISEDPFFKEKIADYDTIEFVPSKYAEGFQPFLSYPIA